jgi:hypothetical protein
MTAAAVAIWILHAVFLAFVVLAPLTGSETLLLFHAIAIPLLWVHWLANDDGCILTVLEASARGVDAGETFMQRLVGPVYKLEGEHARALAWIGSGALWALSVYKLSRMEPGVCGRVFIGVPQVTRSSAGETPTP